MHFRQPVCDSGCVYIHVCVGLPVILYVFLSVHLCMFQSVTNLFFVRLVK